MEVQFTSDSFLERGILSKPGLDALLEVDLIGPDRFLVSCVHDVDLDNE